MRQMSISRVEPGMILAQTLYDEKERILVSAGSKLTDNFIKKLQEYGFNYLCIETKDTEGIVLNDVLPQSVKNKAIKAVKDLDVVSVMDSAKEMVTCICESQNISFDLLDTRNEKSYDYQHAVTVAELSIAMGKLVVDSSGNRLTHQELCDLAVAALLHDIGKRCADRSMLEKFDINKDKIEYTEELAPIFSYNLLKDNSLISSTSRVGILFHQTDENGKSSPVKDVSPQKIHVYAKILHIADAYDSLISRKVNGKTITSAEAIEYLMANCETKFNSDLVRAFMQYVPIYPKGSKVTLSTGEQGVVYENTVGKMMRPKVMLNNGEIIDLFDNPSITVVSESVNYEEVSNNVKSR